MGILSDYDIARALEDEQLRIVPKLDVLAIQPASIDLCLGPSMLEYRRFADMRPEDLPVIDPELQTGAEGGMVDLPSYTDTLYPGKNCWVLKRGGFALGATLERVRIGNTLVGRIDGRSSLARLGLFVHASAGYIDPGFEGNITLEFFNAAPRPIILRPSMGIAQLVLYRATSPSARPYGDPALHSRYQHSSGTVPSRYGES